MPTFLIDRLYTYLQVWAQGTLNLNQKTLYAVLIGLYTYLQVWVEIRLNLRPENPVCNLNPNLKHGTAQNTLVLTVNCSPFPNPRI